jgi:nucleoside-diphosphate-sugar epimerase
MKAFITGATGVLGHRLVERLSDRGHRVIGLTRDEEGDDLVERRGGTPQRGDVLDEESLTAALDDVDVVVHAATKSQQILNQPLRIGRKTPVFVWKEDGTS